MEPRDALYPLPFNPEFHAELGALFISGFEGAKAKGPIIEAVRGGLGGVILFPPNLGSPKEILALTNGLQKAAPNHDLFISIDQEGGRVMRLKAPFTEFPPMSAVGAKNDPDLARRVGRAIATELLAVGINLDYAPVMDLDAPDKSVVIGDRSFGADPDKVAAIGCAFIDGMQGAGVAACAKHFPGHGATNADSHVELPEVKLSKGEMAPHIAPFKAAVAAGVASIMTAHIRCRAIDAYHPATLSGEFLSGMLRNDMGYGGLIITDDMGMKGVSELLPAEDAASLALRAGADILLIAHDLQLAGKLRRAIHDHVRHMLLSPDDVMDKLDRIKAARAKFAAPKSRPSIDVIGCREHQELVKEILG